MEKQKKARGAKREQKKKEATYTKKKMPAMKRMDELARKVDELDLEASEASETSSEDDIPCQECGTTSGGRWIACDGCNSWFHIQCTDLSNPNDLPDSTFVKIVVDVYCVLTTKYLKMRHSMIVCVCVCVCVNFLPEHVDFIKTSCV